MSYVQPFDTLMNLWWTAVPSYEWEPVVVPPQTAGDEAPAGAPAAAPGDTGSCADAATLPPQLRLVFKGMRWVAVPVWSARENPAFDQISQDHRDQDELRAQHRAPPRPKLPEPSPDPAAGLDAAANHAPHGPESSR